MGRSRRRNEDTVLLDPALGLAVVADGMGGLPAGDVASSLAVGELRARLAAGGPLPSALPPAPGSRSPLGDRMVEAVHAADRRVRAESERDPATRGMGCTLTALLLPAGERRVVIGHVGDSRAYLWDGERVVQLTRDHTWVQEQIDAGVLTPEGARGHPWGHLLAQGIGVGEGVEPAVIERDARPGEVYLLCSDGLTGMLTDVAIERLLADTLAAGLEAAARALVDAANDRGGLDNITVALVRVPS